MVFPRRGRGYTGPWTLRPLHPHTPPPLRGVPYCPGPPPPPPGLHPRISSIPRGATGVLGGCRAGARWWAAGGGSGSYRGRYLQGYTPGSVTLTPVPSPPPSGNPRYLRAPVLGPQTSTGMSPLGWARCGGQGRVGPGRARGGRDCGPGMGVHLDAAIPLPLGPILSPRGPPSALLLPGLRVVHPLWGPCLRAGGGYCSRPR